MKAGLAAAALVALATAAAAQTPPPAPRIIGPSDTRPAVVPVVQPRILVPQVDLAGKLLPVGCPVPPADGAGEIIGEKVIGEKVIGEKIIGEKVIGEKVIGEKVIGEKSVASGSVVFGDKWNAATPLSFRHVLRAAPGDLRLRLQACSNMPAGQLVRVNAPGFSHVLLAAPPSPSSAALLRMPKPAIGEALSRAELVITIENPSGRPAAGAYTITVTR